MRVRELFQGLIALLEPMKEKLLQKLKKKRLKVRIIMIMMTTMTTMTTR